MSGNFIHCEARNIELWRWQNVKQFRIWSNTSRSKTYENLRVWLLILVSYWPISMAIYHTRELRVFRKLCRNIMTALQNLSFAIGNLSVINTSLSIWRILFILVKAFPIVCLAETISHICCRNHVLSSLPEATIFCFVYTFLPKFRTISMDWIRRDSNLTSRSIRW